MIALNPVTRRQSRVNWSLQDACEDYSDYSNDSAFGRHIRQYEDSHPTCSSQQRRWRTAANRLMATSGRISSPSQRPLTMSSPAFPRPCSSLRLWAVGSSGGRVMARGCSAERRTTLGQDKADYTYIQNHAHASSLAQTCSLVATASIAAATTSIIPPVRSGTCPRLT